MKRLIHSSLLAVLLTIPACAAIDDACTAGSSDCLATVIQADHAYLSIKGEGRLRFRRAPADRPVLGAILRVSGFGLGRDATCDLGSQLAASEKSTLREEEDRWNLGFHIYSLSWCAPSDYIQRNSFVLEKALQIIHSGGIGSPGVPLVPDAKLVVIGSSMGGLVTRHALARMESEGTPHGVSLFISFDGPQLGAYLPISVQDANQFLLDAADSIGTFPVFGFAPSTLIRLSDDPRALLLTGMDTPAARQLLLVHHSSGSGPHPDFTALQQELDGYGFPSAAGLRRVAIANGSSGATTRDLEGIVFETKRVTLDEHFFGARYQVGGRTLWKAGVNVQFRVPLKLTLTPLTQGGANQEVFRADLSNAELRIDNFQILPAKAPSLSQIAKEIGIPHWIPDTLYTDVLGPVLDGITKFLDDALTNAGNLAIRKRSNAPYAYEAGGGGLGDKYKAFHDALSVLPFASLTGGGEPETFIPTRSAIAVSGDPTVPITDADIAGSPFDHVYFHTKDTNHISMTTKVKGWICKEVHDLIQQPFLSDISPAKRPVKGASFALTVTGGNFNTSSVVTWNYHGKTNLKTTFIDGGTLSALVPASLIADLTACIDKHGCPSSDSVPPSQLGDRADVIIAVENRDPLPAQTSSPDWTPTESHKCDSTEPFQIEEVAVAALTPDQPQSGEAITSTDVIVSSYSADWHDSCVPKDPKVSVQGHSIVVTATNPAHFCFFAITAYTLQFSFGPLAPGDYTLEIQDVRGGHVTKLDTRTFSVQNPLPMALSLTPDNAPAGSPDVTVTIAGDGFVTGATTALFNGEPLLTTVESPSALTASIPASRLQQQGAAAITVHTDDPHQTLLSDPLTFTVGPPELMLQQLDPASVPVNSPDTTITLTGAGFDATSTVEWTRPDATTSTLARTLVDPQHLKVTLPATALLSPATYLLTVHRGGDTSAALTFMITSETAPAPPVTPVIESAADAASFTGPLVPGGLATLFGSDLASGVADAQAFPLPIDLLGTRVLVNGVEAPLLHVSATQINFQVPFETAVGSASIAVSRDGTPGTARSFPVMASAFRAFQYLRPPSALDPILTHADGTLVTPENPAHAGETVVLYGTGVGTLTNPPPSGKPAAANPLSLCTAPPQGLVKGAQDSIEGTVPFCGLTPGYAGLVQINIELPDHMPPGTEFQLVVWFPNNPIQYLSLSVVE